MCGIVGAVAKRDVVNILVRGLRHLEYRGYDSAGIALLNPQNTELQCQRIVGKVAKLASALQGEPIQGNVGIAHTRWATRGQPSQDNAHPHLSNGTFAIVHNGIIENHAELRQQLSGTGYEFKSETDTEVIVHLLHQIHQQEANLLKVLKQACDRLQGAYALGVISADDPQHIYAARSGSPLVIGIGDNENFIASDPIALLEETQRFIYLQEGDIACIGLDSVIIHDSNDRLVEREIFVSQNSTNEITKGEFAHFMLKEIYEQPQALQHTLASHIVNHHLVKQSFGHKADEIFQQAQRIHIVACGTSYHAGLVARHWLETLAGIPCQVEIASENRYRDGVVEPGSLFVAISQSGETADTLAALRQAQSSGHIGTLGICNVPESSLAREADLLFITRAGTEIGVAATKTFTAQLTALLILAIILGQEREIAPSVIERVTEELEQLPQVVENTLALDQAIQEISQNFVNKQHALFLGRGEHHAIAMEGALKLKEISYMHAEAYPAGELKHGPLALVDKDMPVIVIAPNNTLAEKLASNVEEVCARGGELYVFADEKLNWQSNSHTTVIKMPSMPASLTPLAYTIPLQLLSYHVGVLKGTDVDQPRNLAKSVTVE